jgi:crossover junction endodeoxyribonuclease RuvC
MKIVGVDPGKKGALALIDTSTGSVQIEDMPLVSYGKKELVSGIGIAQIIENWMPDAGVIERVSARPGQGSVSMFNFGASYWGAKSVIECFCPFVMLVTPQVWKKRLNLIGTDKEAARELAIRLHPQAAHMLKRKKDEGRAEALLIATYGTLEIPDATAGRSLPCTQPLH